MQTTGTTAARVAEETIQKRDEVDFKIKNTVLDST